MSWKQVLTIAAPLYLILFSLILALWYDASGLRGGLHEYQAFIRKVEKDLKVSEIERERKPQ